MAIIKVPTNLFPVTMPANTIEAEAWCYAHVGQYGDGWHWVAAFNDYLLLRIVRDDDAIAFKLAFHL